MNLATEMEQGSFDWDEQREEQEENRERVSSRIGAAILSFCLVNRQFHAEDLRKFVTRETGISAPASADRILRDLRQRGVIEYRVLNRRESLYEVITVRSHLNQHKENRHGTSSN